MPLHRPKIFVCLFLGSLALGLMTACDTEDETSSSPFINHGVAVPLSESRGIVASQDGEGRPTILVVANNYEGPAGTRLLDIDAETGETRQLPLPSIVTEETGSAYRVLRASNGLVYTSFGRYLVVYDPAAGEWYAAADMGGGTAMSLEEAPGGQIYVGTYPNSRLLRFDPDSKELTELGRLDANEKYPATFAVDDNGVVYAGLGTQNSNLVAYDPETQDFTQLVDDAARKVATAEVYRGEDGRVYGRLSDESSWMQLTADDAVPTGEPADRVEDDVITWSSALESFPGGGRLLSLDLPGQTYRYEDAGGEVHERSFTYRSDGANTTRLGVGPDGAVYGSTSHPLRAFRYRPATDSIEVLGGVDRIGGGNFRSFVGVGDAVYMIAYLGGHLFRYDTSEPWVETEGDTGNPRYLVSYSRHVARPRTMVKHPEENILIGAGFPGYGYAGGGLALYDLDTDSKDVLPNENLLPGLSTITLDFTEEGNLVAGTSVRAPGGASESAEEAAPYVLNWDDRKVQYEARPIEGARDIMTVRVTSNGNILGITGESVLFLYDPEQEELVSRADLSEYGNPVNPDQSMVRGPDGAVYLLMEDAVLTVQPQPLETTVVAQTPAPATAGIGITDNRLYFTSGPDLWSLNIGD